MYTHDRSLRLCGSLGNEKIVYILKNYLQWNIFTKIFVCIYLYLVVLFVCMLFELSQWRLWPKADKRVEEIEQGSWKNRQEYTLSDTLLYSCLSLHNNKKVTDHVYSQYPYRRTLEQEPVHNRLHIVYSMRWAWQQSLAHSREIKTSRRYVEKIWNLSWFISRSSSLVIFTKLQQITYIFFHLLLIFWCWLKILTANYCLGYRGRHLKFKSACRSVTILPKP